ncbi:MAG: hypothetical protein ACYSUC_10345 [Planctomycetota bacterium]
MKNLVKTWLRLTRKGSYVYYLRWIGEDGKEDISLWAIQTRETPNANGVRKRLNSSAMLSIQKR